MLRKYSDWFSVFFILIASALCYPMYFLHPFSYFADIQMLFSMSAISMFCLAIIIFRFNEVWQKLFNRHIFIFFCIVIFIGFIIRQYFSYSGYTVEALGLALLWITIPLFAFIYSEKIQKILPAYFLIFLCFDLLMSYIHRGEQIIGMERNTNWHAIFLWVLNGFSIYFAIYLFRLFPKKIILRIICGAVLIIIFGSLIAFSLYVEVLCRSKAAWLAVIIALFLFICLELYHKCKKYFISFIVFSLIIFALVFSFFMIFPRVSSKNYLLNFTASKIEKIENKVNNIVTEDVRGPLWEGCVNLIWNYPIYGVSQPHFESVYAKFRPLSYFQKPDSAVRSNHPHNSELYIGACYGIPGLIIWLILWGVPIILTIYYYRRLRVITKLCFYSYFIMFIHSQVDLVFYEWPTLLYSAIFLGILWYEIWGKPCADKKINCTHASQINNSIFVFILFILKLLSLIVMLIAIKIVCQNAISTYYFRLGDYAEARGESYTAIDFYSKGLAVREDPYYSMKSAMIADKNLDNYKLAFKYLVPFENGSIYSNYAHSNALLGSVLTKMGYAKMGELYFYQEAVIFPLLVESWYNLYLSAEALNDKEMVLLSSKNLSDLLVFRGLSEKAIPYLMSNYTYDAHQWQIPQELMEKIKIKPNKNEEIDKYEK